MSLDAQAPHEVINTGDAASIGRIVAPDLTSGILEAFTLEVMVRSDDASGVLVNIGAAGSNNVLTLWNPSNLTIGKGFGNDVETGINLVDGDIHRVTLTWDSSSGTLKVYDNGELVNTTTMDAPPADLSMVIGQKAGAPRPWPTPRAAATSPASTSEATFTT